MDMMQQRRRLFDKDADVPVEVNMYSDKLQVLPYPALPPHTHLD
jgi:hypothetical protein